MGGVVCHICWIRCIIDCTVRISEIEGRLLSKATKRIGFGGARVGK